MKVTAVVRILNGNLVKVPIYKDFEIERKLEGLFYSQELIDCVKRQRDMYGIYRNRFLVYVNGEEYLHDLDLINKRMLEGRLAT